LNKPLSNKTIVITRSPEQSETSLKIFENLGANVIQFPTIKITEPESFELFDNAVKKFTDFDYLIFTSANSVKKFLKRINELKISLSFEKIKVIATGSKTADACNEKSIKVDFIPDNYSAEGIIEGIKEDIKSKNIFIPCSAIAKKELSEELSEAGANVTKVPVYDVGLPDGNEIKENVEQLNNSKPHVFVFTSPSTFENFLTILKVKDPEIYFKDFIVAAIGTTTETAINNYGIKTDIVPKVFTMESLAEEIVSYFEKGNLIKERR
jgi:uroporphyrinogen-III synthase